MTIAKPLKTTVANVIFPKRKKNAKRAEGLEMNYTLLAAAIIPFD